MGPHARIGSIRRGPDDASQKDQVQRRTDRGEKTPSLHVAYDSGEELLRGTCDTRGVGGVGALVNTHLAMNIDSYKSLTSRIGHLRVKRYGSVPALTVFVAYAPTSDYDDEEVETFYVELEKFYKEDHTFYKVIVGDFNVWSWKSSIRKITPSTRIRPEHLKNLPPALTYTLALLFTRYLSECKVPSQWKTSRTVLLYKKGDVHDIGNYRPICLLFVVYNLFTRVTLNRISRTLAEGQPCEQAGFRRGFSCRCALRSST
ncbi:unnamed protein product [Heligmosomoides polygyrus]|uniref:Reverse transcriptase domain-containing protein n=1 Tax=Heligmosomoides polygyrus TaxID=6339 RepID=A0A183G483_HELPZ|nr:unnamed protein product [Heligmosomoides polygyrus]